MVPTHVQQAVVVVAPGQSGLEAIVTSGSTILGTQALNVGYNDFRSLA